MKKWKIVVLTSILTVIVMGLSAVLVYNFYIVPQYVEPIVQEISAYVNKEEILDKLYEEAIGAHDSGLIDDDVYAKFIRAYNKSKRNTVENAQEILDEYANDHTLSSAKNNTKSTKYAAYKVGVENVIVNEDEGGGKSEVNYSDERSNERVKAENVVEAERILEESKENTDDNKENDVALAYEKLRANMSSEEFSSFVSIMRKLDIEVLKTYVTDKEGLKTYLHQQLTNEEYKKIVNLGYKYVYIFVND